MNYKTFKSELYYCDNMDREDKTNLMSIVFTTMGYFSLLGLVIFLFRVFLIIYLYDMYIAFEENLVILILELGMCCILALFVFYRIIINIRNEINK